MQHANWQNTWISQAIPCMDLCTRNLHGNIQKLILGVLINICTPLQNICAEYSIGPRFPFDLWNPLFLLMSTSKWEKNYCMTNISVTTSTTKSIAQQLRYNEDGNAADIQLIPLYVGHQKGLTLWASFMKRKWPNLIMECMYKLITFP